jgi:hypothetical protein
MLLPHYVEEKYRETCESAIIYSFASFVPARILMPTTKLLSYQQLLSFTSYSWIINCQRCTELAKNKKKQTDHLLGVSFHFQLPAKLHSNNKKIINYY